MGPSLLNFFLPIFLSLFLLVDASRNDYLPLGKQENNQDDYSPILQDAFEQNTVLLLPSTKKENEMLMEVPQLDQDQLPTETHNRFRLPPRLRGGESDYVFHPRGGESDYIFHPRGGESDYDYVFHPRESESDYDYVFQPREGESDYDYVSHPREGGSDYDYVSHPRKSESDYVFHPREGDSIFLHHHHDGDKMKLGHFRGDGRQGDHLRFRPQFPRSNSFPSSKDHGEEAVSSSFRSFPGKFLPQAENDESRFQPRERAFERVGGKTVFPEREHTHAHGRHGQWEGEFQNGEEHKHERHEDPAAPWTDWLRGLFQRH